RPNPAGLRTRPRTLSAEAQRGAVATWTRMAYVVAADEDTLYDATDYFPHKWAIVGGPKGHFPHKWARADGQFPGKCPNERRGLATFPNLPCCFVESGQLRSQR